MRFVQSPQAAFVPEALPEEEEAEAEAEAGAEMAKRAESQLGSCGSLANAGGSTSDLDALGPRRVSSQALLQEPAVGVGEEEEEEEEAEDAWAWLQVCGSAPADAAPSADGAQQPPPAPPAGALTTREGTRSAATADGASHGACAAAVAVTAPATPTVVEQEHEPSTFRAPFAASATPVAAASERAAAPRKARTYERNKHAEVLVARVAAKLGGGGSSGDGDGKGAAAAARAAMLPVPEQVELLLREATSLDNLCQMYEGWMAWI
jgi:hypothetical protein